MHQVVAPALPPYHMFSCGYPKCDRLPTSFILPTTETKNHWARDDPGFAVLQAFFLVVSTVCCGQWTPFSWSCPARFMALNSNQQDQLPYQSVCCAISDLDSSGVRWMPQAGPYHTAMMQLLPKPVPPSLDSFPTTRCFALPLLDGRRFFVILSRCFFCFAWIKVATLAFGVAFGARGVWTYVGLLLHSVGVHWLLCGVVMSSLCRCGFWSTIVLLWR